MSARHHPAAARLVSALALAVVGALPAAGQIDPAYHDPQELLAELASLQAGFPTLARDVDLNALLGVPPTHEGRSIHGLKISDTVSIDEDEPVVLVSGNIHAREVINVELCLDLAGRLLTAYGNDPELTAVVDAYEVWIVPTLNPDGLARVHQSDPFWRKNRRDNGDGTFGVDLNRNHPFQWFACGSSPSQDTSSIYYVGPAPGSEPETVLTLALLGRLRPAKVFDFHSRGRKIYSRYGCSSWPSALTAAQQTALATAAALMGYSGPTTSSSGGMFYKQASADHAALAAIVETWVGPNWWPPYADALAEIAQVWPGLRFLLELPLPISGHVIDAVSGSGLAATFTVDGVTDPTGMQRSSDPASGRFHAWLPPGTWALSFQAPGYQDGSSGPLTVLSGATTGTTVALLPEPPYVLALDGCGLNVPGSLVAAGLPTLGQSLALLVDNPLGSQGPGATPLLGLSLSSAAAPCGLLVPGWNMDPTQPDGELLLGLPLLATLGGSPWGGPGQPAVVPLPIPANPALVGLTFAIQAVLLDPTGPLPVALSNALLLAPGP